MSIGEVQVALQALTKVDLHYHTFIQVLKICFSREANQWIMLEEHYKEFVKEYRQGKNSKIEHKQKEDQRRNPAKRKYQIHDIKKWLFNLKEDSIEAPFYSPHASLDDPAMESWENIDQIDLEYWIKKMLLKLAYDRRRKRIRSTFKGDLDVSRLIKNKFEKGDELINMHFLYPKKIKTKLVLLCDVSKSMEMHSVFITSLIAQIVRVFDYSEICLFDTDLLRMQEGENWQKNYGLWSGGTRIGQSLTKWIESAPAWVDKKTIFMVYSDGWDTGDLSLLDDALYEIKKMVKHLIWLNPTIKDEDRIQVAGMKIGAKYSDSLAPVYNLASLKDFISIL